MDKQMKLILGLFLIVLVLGGIFALKFFGIIKPNTKDNNKETYKSKLDEVAANIQSVNNEKNLLDENNSTSINEVIENQYNNSNVINNSGTISRNTAGNYENNSTNYIANNTMETMQRNTSEEFSSFLRERNSIAKTTFVFLIVLCLLAFFVNIGIAKLFRKLSMPDWTGYYIIFSPILIIIIFLIFKRIPIYVIITMECISLASSFLFFSSVDINPLWAFVPILITGLEYLGTFGNILSLGLSIAFLVIWIRTISNLAEKFGKGNGFKVGLFFLPFIFFPILGFERD